MKKVALKVPQQGWGSIKTKYPSDSIYVTEDELTGSSKNFDSTVHGILSKRLGGIDYNPTLFPSPAKDQFEAIFTDGVHHLLIVEGGNLRFTSGGGTFALVTAGYSSVGNFEFALFDDRVYFGNGIDSPQVYDRSTTYGGVGYSAPQTKVMGAQAPSSAPTFAADTAGGNVPAGGHTYKVTFLYYDSEESNGGPASALHTVVNPNNTVNLTSIPVGGYGVTARKIYRDDNDGVYRLVGTVADNTTTVFADTASTGTALIPVANNVPPSFRFIVSHLDRTWIAGIPGDPSSLRFSEAGLPDIFPSANVLPCNPEDPITAIVVYDKKVWVFNRNSIGRILGDKRDNFQYVPLPGSVGCVDNRSIRVRTVEGIPTMIWLSDKGIYGTNGSSVEYLSDPLEDLVNLNIQQATQVKGQNAQTSQLHFQAGTASPGIDLTGTPGTITTPNPRRLWDDEADWEGGSSLINVATNDNLNQISVPTRHNPAYADGTHNGTIGSGANLTLTQRTDQGGESLLNISDSFVEVGPPFSEGTAAQPLTFTYSGQITSVIAEAYCSGGVGFKYTIWSDNAGVPGTILWQGPSHFNVPLNVPVGDAVNFNVTGGVRYWLGYQLVFVSSGGRTFPVFRRGPNFTASMGTLARKHLATNVWVTDTQGTALSMNYGFVQTPVAQAGLWIGPTYDSKSDNAVAASISHTGTFPASTSSVTTVEASNDPTMTTGVSIQTFNNLNGSSAVTLMNLRYWSIKVSLLTTDDRNVPVIGPATLTFNTTATWISEVIDHTTDITALNSLSFVTNVPVGTTATIEIATSPDNLTYTTFGPIGSAVVQRYSKVRITLTSTGDNATTPTVTSALLTWTLVSNLVSSAIDTGTTPAGWDLFQAQFALNGGSVLFEMRSATTAPGLTAESFTTVANGVFPSIPVRQFVQWRVTITSMANAVPTVDSVTVNWFISQVSSIRVASLFYNRSYYLAAAEFNQTTNNVVIVFDGEAKWRVYRDININTLSLFFNDPYYGSAIDGRLVRFLSGNTDDAIEMIIETKSVDFNDTIHDKIGRKVYVKGKNTGAVYQLFMSFDEGLTYYAMKDVATGLTSFTTSSDGSRFRRRFQLDFTLGNPTAGKTVKVKIVESTLAAAEIDELRIEAWVRQGELVN